VPVNWVVSPWCDFSVEEMTQSLVKAAMRNHEATESS
jgi:hypothetical protein